MVSGLTVTIYRGQLETEAGAVFVYSYLWQAVMLWSLRIILGALVLCHS